MQDVWSFLVDELEHLDRVERDAHHQGAADHDHAEKRDNAAGGMKQWHRCDHPVITRESGPLGIELGVVDDAVVRKHYALGKAGRAARILDLHNVVRCDARFARAQLGIGYAFSQREHFGEQRNAGPVLGTDQNRAFQRGEPLAS